MLTANDHSRDSAGLTYVYPVVSRRAGGVSIGINLNVNNACNWACIYCQVPDLTRGGPPRINLGQLENELRGFLHDAVTGDFLSRKVPADARRLMDVAFSGNGEPTSATEFAEAVALVERILRDFGLLDTVPLRLITNGSLLNRQGVRNGIARIGKAGGEVWFKVDSATTQGMAHINGIARDPQRMCKDLRLCCALAPTWIQTCYFAFDGKENSHEEQTAYLALIEALRTEIKGVHLYGLARPSLQAEAPRLSSIPQDRLTRFAEQISRLGVKVTINP